MARIADVWPLLLLNPRYLEGGPSAAACLRARVKGFSFSIYLSICLSIYLSMCVIHIRTYTLVYIQAAEEKRKAHVCHMYMMCTLVLCVHSCLCVCACVRTHSSAECDTSSAECDT